MKALLIAVGIIAAIGGVLGISYISAYNTGNRLEQQLKATQNNNRNVLAQYGNRITEAAQITEMQRDDVIKVINAAMEGRYGNDGARQVILLVKEQNPNLDSTVYVQLQRMIESGRREFQVEQTKMLDVKRTYETQLGSFWTGTWLRVAGYPRINLDEFQIVSTERANNAFDTKIEESIKLRP